MRPSNSESKKERCEYIMTYKGLLTAFYDHQRICENFDLYVRRKDMVRATQIQCCCGHQFWIDDFVWNLGDETKFSEFYATVNFMNKLDKQSTYEEPETVIEEDLTERFDPIGSLEL